MSACLLDDVLMANKPDVPTDTVRIPRYLVEMAREVCLHTKIGDRKLKMSSYFEEMVKERITRDHAAVRARILADEASGKKKPPKKEG